MHPRLRNQYWSQSQYMGDPGFFKSIGKLFGKGIKTVAGLAGVGGGGGGGAACPMPAPPAPATDPYSFLAPLLMQMQMMQPQYYGGGWGQGDILSDLKAAYSKYRNPVENWLQAHPALTAGAAGLGGFALGGAAGAGGMRMLMGSKLGRPPIGPPGMQGIIGRPGRVRMTKAGGMTQRRRPRMQVTNTRALKRSLRRVHGFAKIARQVMVATKHTKARPRITARRRRAA